ncbi:DUF3306 domain-containing protein [Bradyrhizobium sp. CSA112]|uniref:DUF3306 domain-containing protein n=1 Tax=Bradyrhizobium sp. CSA112 TaxID=2699170 RepID=UPI0023AFB586|nr:DUF3306 domain-containing protein [Bradyrhizobium sp. CSA112]MDE5451531.1 DUF3306 domain-containing protein [Bradyrhizobium sp. CSA112]
MSGPDEADREKGFLARWSQRKQEAKQPEPKQDAPAAERVESPGLPAPQGEDVTPEFDLSTLPKLEELTGSTDITAFLRKGVPEHLRNAALQKSWALDPAIRNYVNPALEYAYDWNTPGGVPGGGELGAGVDVARLVSQIMGEPAAETTNSGANSEDGTAGSSEGPSERDLATKSQEDLPVGSLRRVDQPAAEAEGVSKAGGGNDEPSPADDPENPRPVAPQQPVRRHGSAKPIV